MIKLAERDYEAQLLEDKERKERVKFLIKNLFFRDIPEKYHEILPPYMDQDTSPSVIYIEIPGCTSIKVTLRDGRPEYGYAPRTIAYGWEHARSFVEAVVKARRDTT